MRKDIEKRKNDIEKWIKERKPKTFICKELSCRPSTLNNWLSKWDIIYKGRQDWQKGIRSNRRKGAIEYLKTTNPSSYILKTKLIEDGIKEHRCEKCNNTEWEGESIPLELHHIDGDSYNNELNNLQILCPNCHSMEPNNAGAGKKNRGNCVKYEQCIVCNVDIGIRTKTGKCKSCSHKGIILKKSRKVKNRPSKETLLKEVEELGYCGTGKKYGVSDNAIRKWLK